MSAVVKLINFSINVEKHSLKHLALLTTIRHGHTIRGKPPGIARTLEQRLKGNWYLPTIYGHPSTALRLCYHIFRIRKIAEENPIDQEIAHRVDIGFPQPRPSRKQQLQDRIAHYKKQRTNPDLEKQARSQTCKLHSSKTTV